MSQIEQIEHPQTITSLEDIVAYKDSLHQQIEQEEERIAKKWNILFHKEEAMPQGKAQKFARMLSLSTTMFDGIMLGWKLYRKYQEGFSILGGTKKKKRK